MRPRKLITEGCRSLGKLFSPAPAGADKTLEAIWPDSGGGCLLDRGTDWLDAQVDLSIIIPCYNNAPYLKACMDSVLGQETSYSFEAVVVDDGSTDETPAILAPYREDPRVKLLRQENKGHSGARNAGLSLCRGRYILFHDSDDTLLPGSIDALLRCAFENNADIALGGYVRKDPSGNITPGKAFPAGAVTDRETVPGMTCGKAFRRSLWGNLQFPTGYWYEDSVISQILLPMAKRIYAIDTPVFAYLLNPQGVSAASQGRPKALESLYITRRLLKERAAFGLNYDADAYTHFLHMVLLTYHRTRLLGKNVPYGVYLCQRQLQKQYFSGLTAHRYASLAQALEKGRFRRYLWLCETLWLRNRMGG